ncbi:hypothetical protein F0U60_48195 [Archangium minus]|uniref:Immediate early protein ICP0 n=1 Tax=Archangium minus TaxID=83450 RepID=A0ABY9X6M5_9BACT|nr:hypothetical protein F0U60_48195 [Archangium minus]
MSHAGNIKGGPGNPLGQVPTRAPEGGLPGRPDRSGPGSGGGREEKTRIARVPLEADPPTLTDRPRPGGQREPRKNEAKESKNDGRTGIWNFAQDGLEVGGSSRSGRTRESKSSGVFEEPKAQEHPRRTGEQLRLQSPDALVTETSAPQAQQGSQSEAPSVHPEKKDSQFEAPPASQERKGRQLEAPPERTLRQDSAPSVVFEQKEPEPHKEPEQPDLPAPLTSEPSAAVHPGMVPSGVALANQGVVLNPDDVPESGLERRGSSRRLGPHMLWNALHGLRDSPEDSSLLQEKWSQVAFGAVIALAGAALLVGMLASL